LLDYMLADSPRHVIINLELKSSGVPDDPRLDEYVDTVLHAVASRHLLERTYLQSFDWRIIRLARSRQPTLLTGLLTDQHPRSHPRTPVSGQPSIWTDGFDLADYGGSVPRMIHATGTPVWSAHFVDLDAALVEEAHDLGLRVYTWTVNDIRDMERLVRCGVDAITTDYPERLVELLRR